MKSGGQKIAPNEDQEELKELQEALQNNPMLYPLVDDYYDRQETLRGKYRLICKQT